VQISGNKTSCCVISEYYRILKKRTGFLKNAVSEAGASERNRTSDKRFTKPLLEILSHLAAIGKISQQLLSYPQEDVPTWQSASEDML